MAQRIDVMISSTARDLPAHRQQVMDAVLRLGMHPLMMEHLPASDSDAIDASLDMVDEAEIYVGIFAYRYGYVPDSPKNPQRLSVTEMELNHALERGIPCLIFLMDKAHPITMADTDEDSKDPAETARRKGLLDALKNRMSTGRVVNFFKSPEELRSLAVASLAPHRIPDPAGKLHPPSDIPEPPAEYIAHTYSLLATKDFIGRNIELNLLTDWITRPRSDVYHARILNIVAIGGMGKSALTWKWFNDIAPREAKWAGRLWWSFYESDAHYENFIIRALAYVSQRPKEEIAKLTPPERENQLLAILDREPFLLVLDGLERILIAYARMDAAHLSDSDYDRQLNNVVAGAYGLPPSAADSFVGQHPLRKTADPRAGAFLRKLAGVKASRILVSTRLYPSELQSVTGYPITGSFAYFLTGLTDDDALTLWRDFKLAGADGVSLTGGRDKLLPIFNRFGNHPLIVRALAGEVANFKRQPGDLDRWLATNRDFESKLLGHMHVDAAQAHVLDYALRGLSDAEKQVLHTIAAFRMPASYDTLAALLVGEPSSPDPFSLREKGSYVLPQTTETQEGRAKNALEVPLPEGEGGNQRLHRVRAEHAENYREMVAKVIRDLARNLRGRQTDAETTLWEYLRDRRLADLKFRRQHPIAKTTYVVDFFCYKARLIVELDGGVHDSQQAADQARQRDLEALGYQVIRFRNEQVFNDLETTLATIAAAAQPSSPNLMETGSETPLHTTLTQGALGEQIRSSPDSPLPEGEGQGVRAKPFTTENQLDFVLTMLEDRGLVGWDRRSNRYDLHPITRGVTWNALDADAKREVYATLETHFQAMPAVDQMSVTSLDDLTGAIELYHTLIGLGRYDDARIVFRDRLASATHFRLSSSRQNTELLAALFPAGVDAPPKLTKTSDQGWTLNELAMAYHSSGQPGRAAPFYQRNVALREKEAGGNPSVGLRNLADALRQSGGLYAGAAAARRALVSARERNDEFGEAVSLYFIGLIQAARGADGMTALRRSLRMWIAQRHTQSEGLVNAYLAGTLIQRGEFAAARPYAERAWKLAHDQRSERDFIDAACRQGQAALGLGDFASADERLHHALTRARAINFAEEELPALIGLAELARQRSDPAQARDLLDAVWELAERGPYPLFHADALNILAQIERDAGDHDAAVKAATEAYIKAWCDGISADGKDCFAYWWGLQKAKAHLDALGAPYPALPPFDPSAYEPLPEVEIDPPDEYNTSGWTPYAEGE